jgi:hypothetical protein
MDENKISRESMRPAIMADDSKVVGVNSDLPGAQPGKPIGRGLTPQRARENDTAPLRDPAKRNKGGRPKGSVNRYTGALKELVLLAAENVGDRLEIGEKGERTGEGGALAFLEVCAIKERKTFLTVMARFLPITIKTAPPIKKVLTREEALHELRERGLDPGLIDHIRRLPFPVEEKSKLDEIYPAVVDLEYSGDEAKLYPLQTVDLGSEEYVQGTTHHLIALGIDCGGPRPGAAQPARGVGVGLTPSRARENAEPPAANRNRGGRPAGSPNRYTGVLKELFLLAADNVGDRTKIGPNGERHGEGGALAYLETCAIEERKTFLTVMARLLPITIKTAPPIKKVLTREEALHELRERGLDPELFNHLRRLPFPVEKSRLDEIYPPIVELDEDEYAGDKQSEDTEG